MDSSCCEASVKRCLVIGMQVNYLSHWLLTHQLLAGQQQLRKSQVRASSSQPAQQTQQSAPNWQQEDMRHISGSDAAAGSRQQSQHGFGGGEAQGTRVVMLTSMTHSAGRIKFDDLHAKKEYNGFHRYADAKLAILLAVREFAHRLDRQVASGTR